MGLAPISPSPASIRMPVMREPVEEEIEVLVDAVDDVKEDNIVEGNVDAPLSIVALTK